MERIKKRNTVQKQIVENIVLSACDHPCAETIYERARDIIPNISLGTVYRILKALTDEGAVREITVPSAPSRFDKTTRIHAHFVCRVCREVTDIEVDEPRMIKEACERNENSIDEAEIIFRGLCPACKEKSKYESVV